MSRTWTCILWQPGCRGRTYDLLTSVIKKLVPSTHRIYYLKSITLLCTDSSVSYERSVYYLDQHDLLNLNCKKCVFFYRLYPSVRSKRMVIIV